MNRTLALRMGCVVAILVVSSFLLPRFVTSIGVLDFICVAAILAIAAIGYDLLIGSTGMFALGQAGFMCLGAYAAGYVGVSLKGSAFEAACLAVALPVAATIVIGAPSLRLRGVYFGVATLVFSILVVAIASAWTPVTGGATGLAGLPPLGGGNVFKVNYLFWLPFSGCSLAVLLGLAWALNSSRIGDAWRTIARDELLAANLGINVFRYKMLAFLVSAAFAGYAGFLFAYYLQFLAPDGFGLRLTISLLLMVFLGGAGTVWGPVIGALVVHGLFTFLPSDTNWFEVLFAVVVLAVLGFMPRGVAGLITGAVALRKPGRFSGTASSRAGAV
jgi:branched-chain amino acid transport system permease protein